ncbi:MAG: helix-turn-helix domain-containing protein, partial [Mycobacteriales bacterium]
MADSVEITRLRIALGRQLAAFRRAAGYTQHQLAPLTNYVRGTVGNVEVGRQNVPRSFWERCD